MRLLPKTALTIGVAVALGLSAIFAIAGTVLRSDVEALEEDAAYHDGRRVASLVNEDLRDLEWSAQEVAGVAQVLFFSAGSNGSSGAATDPNQTTALFNSLFSAGDIDAIFVADDNFGWFGVGFDLSDPEFFIEPPEALNRSLQHSSLMDDRGVGEAASSAYVAGDKLYLVATYPLFSPDGSTSMMAVVRCMDESYIGDLTDRSHENVEVYPWMLGLDDDEAAWGVASDDVHFERLSGSTMSVAFRVDGPDGEPAGLVRFQQARAVIQNNDQSLLFFMLGSTVVSVLLIGAALMILRQTVTGRVDNLSRRMQHIAKKRTWDERVDDATTDEVGRMAQSFNGLMASLESNTQRLERSNQDLEAFAHVVSHDLKSPMSTFNLNLHLLEKDVPDNEESRKRVRRMKTQLDGMRDRIDAILEYSRSRHAAPEKRRISMDQIVDRVAEDLESAVQESGAHVTADALPHVHADADQMALVIQNLMANAIKFHQPDQPPRIHIHANRRGNGWAVHVDDEGIGFKPGDEATMFRAFGRLETATHKEGQGIGLATCARIAERHGGTMSAHSRPGHGARFTLWLPDPEPGPTDPSTRRLMAPKRRPSPATAPSEA